MKTKPISIRFDENDLILAKNLSGIKKTQKLIDTLLSEYVKSLKGNPIELPKDYMEFKNIVALKQDGTLEEIIVEKEKPSADILLADMEALFQQKINSKK